MSFFPSIMGDFDDDPFTGHMRHMNRMMSSFFNASPFGAMMTPFGMNGPPNPGHGHHRGHPANAALMPFGFPDMSQMFQQSNTNGNNCHSFSSSTITTMSNGPDGQPQVYQAVQSVRSGPGGVKETKKAVADSRTGLKRMAIGHHIGERAHIIEREHNLRNGQQVENQEYINLDEEEAPEFNEEWQQKTRASFSGANAIGYGSAAGSKRYGHNQQPAIMPPPPPSRSVSRNVRKTKLSPALASSSTRGGQRLEGEDHDDDDEEDGDHDDDDDDCGVKIVEVDDDDDDVGVEGGSGNLQTVTASSEEEDEEEETERAAAPVVYDVVPGDYSKSQKRSRAKKRSHDSTDLDPQDYSSHKSQKMQNKP